MVDCSLSLCSTAMLAIVVDKGDVRVEDLRGFVPPQCTSVAELMPEWPRDISEWIDDLQALLDRGYVVRAEMHGDYIYRPTSEGTRYVHAWLHPQTIQMRSVA